MIREWLSKRGIWYHSQNLTNDEKYSRFWHGRAWLSFQEGEVEFHWEWLLGRQDFCHAYIEVGGGEDDLSIGLALPYLPAIWFHINTPWTKFKKERSLSLEFHHSGIWWKLWVPRHEWNSETPRWRDGNFYFVDFFLGERQHTREDLGTNRITISLPEGNYEGICTIFRSTWKRPRWPWPLVLIRADIEMEKSIPIPGKGDDAIHSLTTTASTIPEAREALIKMVLDRRKQYGWREEKV